ncbi:hypothetical protein ACXOQJ_09525, partial [Streptococcus thermophilus]
TTLSHFPTLGNLGASKFCDVPQFSVLERIKFVCSFCEQSNLLENVGIKRPNYPTVGQTKIETSLNPSKTPVARFYIRGSILTPKLY